LGIAVNLNGCAHVTGRFTEDLEFLPADTRISMSPLVRDMVVAKMCPLCCPPNPKLNIVRVGDTIVLSWDGPCCVLQATDVLQDSSTVWTTITGMSPITIQIFNNQYRFFRLSCQ